MYQHLLGSYQAQRTTIEALQAKTQEIASYSASLAEQATISVYQGLDVADLTLEQT